MKLIYSISCFLDVLGETKQGGKPSPLKRLFSLFTSQSPVYWTHLTLYLQQLSRRPTTKLELGMGHYVVQLAKDKFHGRRLSKTTNPPALCPLGSPLLMCLAPPPPPPHHRGSRTSLGFTLKELCTRVSSRSITTQIRPWSCKVTSGRRHVPGI